MLCCQNWWFLLFVMVVWKNYQSVAERLNESQVYSDKGQSPPMELITQDVIHDELEMNIKKIIRVNPLDLPAFKDDTEASSMESSWHQIQTLKPYKGQRKYINLQRSKPHYEATANSSYTGAFTSRAFSVLPNRDKTLKARHHQRRKHLHFIYNQTDLGGNMLSKTEQVRVAPGAYPVYYVIAKTNGHFGKYPLKSFGSVKEFMKYLQKSKFVEKEPVLTTLEGEV